MLPEYDPSTNTDCVRLLRKSFRQVLVSRSVPYIFNDYVQPCRKLLRNQAHRRQFEIRTAYYLLYH